MDCYSTPERIYSLAKARRMDFVTITDHDSIEGCLDFLNKYPEGVEDFFMGEEVTTFLPEFNTRIHVAVYDITEAQHREITRLKANFDDLLAYLRANRIIYVLNHFFLGFPAHSHARPFVEKMLNSFDLFEGVNGAISNRQNHLLSSLIPRFPGKAVVAGSDSHTLLRLASCYTASEGKTKRNFLENLRSARIEIFGRDSRFIHVFNDAMGVYLAYFRDIAFRNEVHRDWSVFKKIRNGFGWAGWLPVFFTLSLVYSFLHYRQEELKEDYYEALLMEFL
jgi:predicted metal-dependent phosphoesterase TrpH